MTARTIVGIAFFLVCILCTSPPLHASGGPGSTPQKRSVDPRQQLENLPPDLEFEPGVIIVKFKESTRQMLAKHAVALPALTPLLAEFGVTSVTQMYPKHEAFLSKTGNEISLDRLYRIEFSVTRNPLDVAKAFVTNPDVEYAEPEVIQYCTYVPNDPRYSEQYMHQLIHSEEAWEITTGSEDVVIGIVDSGVNWNHEDLADNIWVNPGEDIDHDGVYTVADLNGIDDDNNGYVDDIIGIDFIGDGNGGGTYYDNDPQPTTKGNPHGTHVAGIAAGVGDNEKGIAGVAYTCKILPVKCGTDVNTPRISRGYDGIVYAADNGAKIINCSWGGGGYLASQNERIEYAISQGALVVAAAGNSGREYISTPGAYPNVLCVANVTSEDKVASSSTYGTWVDVSAPGTLILSSISSSDTSYASFTGTSMASPVVAGLAGLVLSNNPSFGPLQIGEQIRVTSDNIDALNPFYKQKIGKGRVNAYRALTVTSAAIRLTDWSYSDSPQGNGNGILDQGETFTVTMEWQNLLAPANDVSITLSSPNTNVTIENPSIHVGALASMATYSNASDPFIIHIADTYAPNEKIDLIYSIVDGDYDDEGGVYVLQQPTYRDHDINKIHVTLSNDGNIGYDDFNGMRGSGLVYDDNGHDILFEGAFLIGARLFGKPVVLDVARDSTAYSQSEDFTGQTLYDMNTPGASAPQQGHGRWNDDNTPLESRLFIEVVLDSYEFTDPQYSNFVLLKYSIINNYYDDYTDFHAGLFFDWDISSNAYSDYAGYDSLTRTMFALDSSGGVPTHIGVAVLTNDSLTNVWALRNGSADDSVSIGIYNGFTKDEKWRALTSGIASPVAGVSDISQMISNGPYTLQAQDSLIIGFVIIADTSTDGILATTPIARAKWDSLRSILPSPVQTIPQQSTEFQITSVYPQPYSIQSGAPLTIGIRADRYMPVTCELVDILGRTIRKYASDELPAGTSFRQFDLSGLSTGLYRFVVKNGTSIQSRAVVIAR